MNKVILMGRLTADPEFRQTPSGVNLVRFTLAVNRRFQKNETDFINCVAWRQTADFICKYFYKGDMIAVIGNIQTRSWEDKDGKKVYATEVIADEAYFTGTKLAKSKQGEDTSESLPDLDFLEEFTEDSDFSFLE